MIHYEQRAQRRVDRDAIDVFVMRYDDVAMTSEFYADGSWHRHVRGVSDIEPMVTLDGMTAHCLKSQICRAINDAARHPDVVLDDLNDALRNFVWTSADA